MSRRLTGPLVTFAGCAAFVAALLLAGRAARDYLLADDRFTVPVADVRCPAPPGVAPADFLGEVQYLGALPERLPVLDPELPAKLRAAFARHPWVEAVGAVEATVAGVRADLTFRAPVLAVGDAGTVDAKGVRLPPVGGGPPLPRLRAKVNPPAGPTGSPWGDDRVAAAAALAAELKDAAALDLDGGDWVVTHADGRRTRRPAGPGVTSAP